MTYVHCRRCHKRYAVSSMGGTCWEGYAFSCSHCGERVEVSAETVAVAEGVAGPGWDPMTMVRP